MELIIAIGLLWLAYRIIRNGFVYSQSEKLGCFGIVGVIVIGIVIAHWLGWLS